MKKENKPKVLVLVQAKTLPQCFQDVASIYPDDVCREDADGIILVGVPGDENIHAGTDPRYGNIFDVTNMLKHRYNGQKINKTNDKFYTPKDLVFGVRPLTTDADALLIAKKYKVDLLFTSDSKIKNVASDDTEDSVPQIVAKDSFVFPDCVDENVEYVVVDLQNWKNIHHDHTMSGIAAAVAMDSVYQR